MAEHDIQARLDAKFRRDTDGGRRVVDFAVLSDGHAGLTYEFATVDATSGGDRHDYVLKIAPFGVVRRGNTDVYRQAPLLKALRAGGVPVPDVPYASPADDELGTPYIIMERLPGRSFVPWEPHASFDRSKASLDTIWRGTVEALATIHAFDWKAALADWEKPRDLSREVSYWTPLLDKAESEETRRRGRKLAEQLSASCPTGYRIGLVHGDYQPGNVLFKDGALTGIIDWELASIGAQGLDLGWLAMMADANCWLPGWRPVSSMDADQVGDIYADAIGHEIAERDWFEALACFRLGAISCLNVRLHRTGRRVDHIWECFAPGIDTMFERGIELTGSRRASPRRAAS